MTEPGATLIVRTAVIADAPSVAAIGRVAFPAVHNDVVGPEFAAVVVEQTYSIEALTECITRCTAAIDAEFLVSACIALYETIQRFLHPQDLTHLWVLAAAGAIGFLGNEIAAQVRLRAGRRLSSPALIARRQACSYRRVCLARSGL